MGTSYGGSGQYVKPTDWSLVAMGGSWCWGNRDYVNASDPVSTATLAPIEQNLNGTSIARFLRQGATDFTYDLPNGGSERCGIYTYPTGPFTLEFKFNRGIVTLKKLRFYCTRAESATFKFESKLGAGGDWKDNVDTKEFAPPRLTNGSHESSWIVVNFKTAVQLDHLKMTLVGSQFSFHHIQFEIA